MAQLCRVFFNDQGLGEAHLQVGVGDGCGLICMDLLKPVAFAKQRIGHSIRYLYSFDTLTKRGGGEGSKEGEGQQQERRRVKQHLDDQVRSMMFIQIRV